MSCTYKGYARDENFSLRPIESWSRGHPSLRFLRVYEWQKQTDFRCGTLVTVTMLYTLYVFILSYLGQAGKVVAFFLLLCILIVTIYTCGPTGPSSLPTMNPSRTLHLSEMAKEKVQMVSSLLVGSKPSDALVFSEVKWQEHCHLESACAAANHLPGSN
jgi:hypothetical protein